MEKKLTFEEAIKAMKMCAEQGQCSACPAAEIDDCYPAVSAVALLRIEALTSEKERADRLAEKLKSVVVENTLLKDALHKMGTAAQETDVWQMKLDAFYFRCKSMATCARCPVYTHKAVSTLCLRPSQEFTEAELDTLLACFGNTNKGGTDK